MLQQKATTEALFFGSVLLMCRKQGMSDAEILKMFHPDNIKGGLEILNDRRKAES